nr:Chain F, RIBONUCLEASE, RNE/RNG FAMILY PROTEIN [Caulobacter vibrioides CB15]4AID_G Chain G, RIBONUCLEASE, RNE/RNG FAMILY PROTEIN [Caulobacter vibrioides CB15]4AID_H Chain H, RIBONUCLEASE, RNE/RNG FAMILY PROTEIN [Caulobacter vibrioides CB15]4AIM_C Chain C, RIBONUCLEASE, RNE/RNG FAMILY PROTEIN [Caulobacter vibrioides]
TAPPEKPRRGWWRR